MPSYPVGYFKGTHGRAVITGTIYDADSSTPVSGASISALGVTATSAGDGTYSMRIPRGVSATIACTKTGYYFSSKSVITDTSTQNFSSSIWNGGVMKCWWDFSTTSGLYQDAAGTTPVVANSDPIRYATDKSGTGNTLLNSAAIATVPLYKTNIQNSLSGVYSGVFYGQAKHLKTAAFTELPVPNTIIVAYNCPGANTNEVVYDSIDSNKRHTIWWGSGGLAYFSGTVRESTNKTKGNALVSCVFANSTSARMRRNGGVIKSGESTGAQGLTGLTILNQVTLAYPFFGYIYEMFLYDGDIGDTCIGYTESYLNSKWALY